MDSDIEIVKNSNQEMLTYFNRIYEDHASTLQKCKSKLFELNIRIEELTKTENLYALNTDFRKNLFSPLHTETEESKKESAVKQEVDQLKEKRQNVEDQIDKEQIVMKSLETRLQSLHRAEKEIQKIAKETEKEKISPEEEKFEFLNFEGTDSEDSLHSEEKERKEHFHHILMLETFDETYQHNILQQGMKESSRSDLTDLLEDLDGDHFHEFYQKDKSFRMMLEDFMNREKENHPEIAFDIDLTYILEEPDYLSVYYFYKLFQIFLQNIYQHAKANHVKIACTVADHHLTLKLSDNGVGKPTENPFQSLWYQGIERAREILFLLNGSFHIENTSDLNTDSGTTVTFSFPLED